MQMQYFSKWELKWVDFDQPPTKGDLYGLKKYHYQIRQKPEPMNDKHTQAIETKQIPLI